MKSLEPWEKHLKTLLEKSNIAPNGVLHVGAHAGQEVSLYKDIGFNVIRLVEPMPKYARRLKKLQGVQVLEAAIGTHTGLRPLHVTSYDQGTSLLVPLDHKKVSELEVETIRLDSLPIEETNVLVVDSQGTELDVLESGRDKLSYFDMLIIETTHKARYVGGATTKDVARFLSKNFRDIAQFGHKNFSHVDTVWTKR